MFNKLIGGYKEKNISNREKREREIRGEKRTIQTEDGV